jgi:hypothetical protein
VVDKVNLVQSFPEYFLFPADYHFNNASVSRPSTRASIIDLSAAATPLGTLTPVSKIIRYIYRGNGRNLNIEIRTLNLRNTKHEVCRLLWGSGNESDFIMENP